MTPTATASSTTAATTPPACRTRVGRTAGTASRSPTVRCPKPPIGLVEVQGYAYAALLGAAELTDVVHVGHDAAELRRRAADLRERFNDVMWDRRGWFALGVDGAGRPIDSLTTNPGHALWSGIAERRAGRPLPRSLCVSRRCGRDGACAPSPRRWAPTTRSATTTARCGRTTRRSARPVPRGTAAGTSSTRSSTERSTAATHFGGRPPELFAGIAREEVPDAGHLSGVVLTAGMVVGVGAVARARDARPRADSDRRRARRHEFASVPTITVSGLRVTMWPFRRHRGRRCRFGREGSDRPEPD